MHNIKPLKRLGQNFLVNKGVVRKIIQTANLQPKDIVLEIGPGLGALTKKLAKRAGKVIAVEKDPRMCEILQENLKDFKNVEIVRGDILKLDPKPEVKPRQPRVLKSSFKIVANLPFYITAPVIRKFLEAKNPPKEMVLIVQKEVAQRICAKPPRMNLLAISVQFYARPEIIAYVSKKAFWPQPKVDAAILKITPHNKSLTPDQNPRLSRLNLGFSASGVKLFFKIVRAGFSHPRKQLINNLPKEISSLLPDPKQRAENLTINDWLKLTKVLK